jgi:mRNA-degrading endonuclease toxin of MazEF toxin-antitoxin module
MRAIDKNRLVKKLGTIGAKTLHATLNTLQETFAL